MVDMGGRVLVWVVVRLKATAKTNCGGNKGASGNYKTEHNTKDTKQRGRFIFQPLNCSII